MHQPIWGLKSISTNDKLANIALFALNPLVLIETVSNIHNDVIMMFLALLGIWLAIDGFSRKHYIRILLAIVFFSASVSIKFATISLIGGFAIYLAFKMLKPNIIKLGEWLSLSIWLPLVTARSQRFLPWYMVWSASFLPLMRDSIWRRLLIAFTFSAMLGYLPFMYYGQHSTTTYWLRTTISFAVPLLIIFFQSVWSSWSKKLKAS